MLPPLTEYTHNDELLTYVSLRCIYMAPSVFARSALLACAEFTGARGQEREPHHGVLRAAAHHAQQHDASEHEEVGGKLQGDRFEDICPQAGSNLVLHEQAVLAPAIRWLWGLQTILCNNTNLYPVVYSTGSPEGVAFPKAKFDSGNKNIYSTARSTF